MKKSGRIIHRFGVALAAFTLCGLTATIASATPSTQIWIPSTDIQAYKTVHLNFDTYLRASTNDDGSRTPPVVVIGPTVGVLPFQKIQAEVGFDVISAGGDVDKYPLYGHFKLGMPEDNTWIPAVAAGMYNIGTKSGDVRKGELATRQDIAYALVAKTLPVVGRLSAGYFAGNKKVLLDKNGESDEKGVLLSWDRTMTEISDKLWLAVDYQGSKSALGALSFGASWAFAKNVSVILGYDIYNEKKTGGQNTVTLQVDINFP
jgi:opacity protein-like surface antigen